MNGLWAMAKQTRTYRVARGDRSVNLCRSSVNCGMQNAPDRHGRSSAVPYGCFLPDLTRFGTWRRPSPSEAFLKTVTVYPEPIPLQADPFRHNQTNTGPSPANGIRGFLVEWGIICPLPETMTQEKTDAMYPTFYMRISGPFQTPGARRALSMADKVLVVAVAATFLGIGAWLALHQDMRVVRYLSVCAVSFVALSTLRAILNRPRPYEAFDIDPLIPKDTQGKSFPSRHVFSAAVIACALLWMSPWLGTLGFAATAVLSVVRVVGGVHFPRDVIAGALLGIACGIVGFWIV